MTTSTPISRRLVIAGGSGFIGRALARTAGDRFSDIVVLTRGEACIDGRVRYVHWDAKTVGDWAGELDGAAAIVNLVGRTVDCVKTPANRAVILSSRVDSVNALAAAYAICDRPPPVWVQSATAHIFGDTADEILDDDSPIGDGFAPIVGTAWEKAFYEAGLHDDRERACRRVALRISFVLGRDGGALKTLARLARFGLGGTVGSGRQWMSWVHIDDLTAIILRAIDDETMSGNYVVTAPQPETNATFMRELRRAVRRPWSPPTPEVMVRLGSFFLRTDPELALLGRRVVPTRLLREGFQFSHPALAPTLDDLLTHQTHTMKTP